MARVSGVEIVLITEVVSRPSTVVETQVSLVSVSDVEYNAKNFPVSLSMSDMMPKFSQSQF